MRNEEKKRFLVAPEKERDSEKKGRNPKASNALSQTITCPFVAPIPLRAPQLQHQGSLNDLSSLRRKLCWKKEAANASRGGGGGTRSNLMLHG